MQFILWHLFQGENRPRHPALDAFFDQVYGALLGVIVLAFSFWLVGYALKQFKKGRDEAAP